MPEGDSFYFYTTILFSFATIITLLMYYFSNTTCPPPRVISSKAPSTVPVPTIDLQFSQTNFPSVQYEDVFKGNNVWQGGYNLLNQGKSTLTQN